MVRISLLVLLKEQGRTVILSLLFVSVERIYVL